MDITESLQIAKTPPIIARTMFDPTRDPLWIGGVVKIEFLAMRPSPLGVRVRRYGAFMGRQFSWVTEVIFNEPNRKLVMRVVEGPMEGEVSYDIVPTKDGSVVRIRDNSSSRFSMLGMAWMLRRSVRADL